MTTVPWTHRPRQSAPRESGPPDRKPVNTARWLAWLLFLLPVVLILVYPTAQDHLRAASLLARFSNPHDTGWLARYDEHPVEVRDTSFEFRGQTIPARLYMPRGIGFAPAIMVVHGMHQLGMNEPRVVRFASVLAAGGFFVMTPEVPGIADYRVEAESADLIGKAAQSFAQQIGAPKVGVLAVSFSGGLALLAATDPQYSSSIAWVATVGAHYNLAHVLRFFATGQAVRPDGHVEHLHSHEYGPLIVVYDEAQDFFPPADVETARRSIKLLLAGDGDASLALTKTMSPAGQQTMQRIYHRQRETFASAILAEIDKKQDQLAAASPAGHLRFLRVPVFLLHGSDDTVIPPTELLWLKRDIPRHELRDALVSPAINHAEMQDHVTLWDRLQLVHWLSSVIHQARSTPDGRSTMPLPAGVWMALPETKW